MKMIPSIPKNSRIAFKQQGSGAFTLLEVMLAMSLLILLSTALFSLIHTSVSAASELEKDQTRSRQLTGFIDLCQQGFRSLPPDATLLSETREVEGQFLKVIILDNAPQSFAWGDTTLTRGQTQISTRPQLGGLFHISLMHPSKDPGALRMNEPQWLHLVHDVRELSWRFFDPRSASWIEEWKDASHRPSLIELKLLPAESDEPIIFTFWIPPLSPPPGSGAPPPGNPK